MTLVAISVTVNIDASPAESWGDVPSAIKKTGYMYILEP